MTASAPLLTAVILGVGLLCGAVLLRPGLRARAVWRAMVTPLASIIGSGFLVLGPILATEYGWAAPLVMAALCLGAWAFGGAIRANIARIGDGAAPNGGAENLGAGLLALAYVISVSYYLNLFGAFAVEISPFSGRLPARIVTTAIFLVILVLGWTRGFAMLERAEYATVTLKLAVIGGMIAGLCVFAGRASLDGALLFPEGRSGGIAALTLGFGLLVTVQGFETARYLGDSYDARTRIRAMRLAQLVATGIYLTYVVLTVYALPLPPGTLSETAVIAMMRQVAPVLPLLLTLGALAAQFSAAVADTGGAGGLLAELSRQRLSPRQGYLALCLAGIALTWAADVFQIIAFASRAFAAYYAVQAAIAARHAETHRARAGWALLAGLGVAIALFGQAVEG